MSTYNDRLAAALAGADDEVSRLLRYAYYSGKTKAAREVCEAHAAIMTDARTKAARLRYKHMASGILPASDTIYHGDYSGDYPDTFGGDETTI